MTDERGVPDWHGEPGEPIVFWAILRWDAALGEDRVCGIYSDASCASTDAMAMESADARVSVEPWQVFTASRFGSSGEPAWELGDDDFDVPVHGAGV